MAIDGHELKVLVSQLADLAGTALGSVDIFILDDAGIAPINSAAVGHEGATDVITLPYEPIPGIEGAPTAEIFVNAQRAVEQRPDAPLNELAYYIAHAFDHLSGRDDATPRERTAMHRRERRWLKCLGISDGCK